MISVLWVLYGFNLAYVDGSENDWIPAFWVTRSPTSASDAEGRVRQPRARARMASVIFGATFAIITVALVSGAIADRARFWPWMLFAGIWATFVYFPVQGWVLASTTPATHRLGRQARENFG